MVRTASRRGLAAVFALLLLTSGCGGSEPEPLTPMQPAVPADLCALVPDAAKAGLVANANSDETGNPTAACSLRSEVDDKPQVRAVVTWIQLNDEILADEVLDSQCQAIDLTEFKKKAGFAVEGAERGCAATGSIDGADSATLAAVSDREVVTVRLSEQPGAAPVLPRAQQMLEGVLSSMAG